MAYLDDFIRDHAGQLKHWRVPEALYEQVYQKLTNEVFDAGSAFMFAHEEAEEEGAVGDAGDGEHVVGRVRGPGLVAPDAQQAARDGQCQVDAA